MIIGAHAPIAPRRRPNASGRPKQEGEGIFPGDARRHSRNGNPASLGSTADFVEAAVCPTVPPPAADLPALTSLRFLAAGMIFVFHLREYAPSAWAVAIGPATYHGVSFFFVLSGFVLTHVYGGREVSVGRFWLARFARIAPLHLATLLLLVAVIPLPYAVGQRLAFGEATLALALKTAMLDAWVPIRAIQQSWNNVSWSISAEMAFYAAFPFLLAAMLRRPLAVLAAVAAVSLAVFLLGAAWLPVADPGRDVPSLLPSRLLLAAGARLRIRARHGDLPRLAALGPAGAPHLAVWTAIEAAALSGAVLGSRSASRRW